MRFAIAYSKNNIAGRNIVNQFKKLAFSPHIPLIEVKEEVIYSENLDNVELKKVDFLVFVSTHKSKDKIPSLTIHAPGNWRSADLGGIPGKICTSSAFVMKSLFIKLNELAEKNKEIFDKYKITLEATHHGPLINIPCCFVELGSSELEWKDENAANVLAETILSLQDFKIIDKWIPVIAIGGNHYCQNFNEIQVNSNYAISHIIPEYSFPITEAMIKEAEEKTLEQINKVLIDWKGCGKSEERKRLLDLLEKLGLKYERTSNVEK